MIIRRTLHKTAAAATATSIIGAPAIAQGTKKISFLTWNIIDQKELIEGWIKRFQSTRAGVEVAQIQVADFSPLALARAGESYFEATEAGEAVIMAAGVPPNQSASTNLIKIHVVVLHFLCLLFRVLLLTRRPRSDWCGCHRRMSPLIHRGSARRSIGGSSTGYG